MNFAHAEKFLDTLKFNLRGFDLRQIKRLAGLAHLAPEKLKVVHVAGTNGKYSTASFISHILREEGYKVGSYYSPHLLSPRERIRINNKNITENEFAGLVSWLKPIALKMKRKPSYFEFLTAMAIEYFQDRNVDWVVAEVGLGGRLDATNVLKGRACVFTDISLEHTELLGKTVLEIAGEKAAIIKNNSTVIAGRHNKGLAAIKKTAKEKKARLITPEFKAIESGATGNVFDLISPGKIKNLKTGLVGDFQAENAALAAAAALALKAGEDAIRSGLLKPSGYGRMQLVKKKPMVLLDSAHNPKAMKKIMENLKLFNYEKLIVVFGLLADKDAEAIMGKLKYDVLILTTPRNARALSPEKLNLVAEGKGRVEKSVASAIGLAEETAGENDMVLVCGSNYMIAEAMQYFKIK